MCFFFFSFPFSSIDINIADENAPDLIAVENRGSGHGNDKVSHLDENMDIDNSASSSLSVLRASSRTEEMHSSSNPVVSSECLVCGYVRRTNVRQEHYGGLWWNQHAVNNAEYSEEYISCS